MKCNVNPYFRTFLLRFRLVLNSFWPLAARREMPSSPYFALASTFWTHLTPTMVWFTLFIGLKTQLGMIAPVLWSRGTVRHS